MGSDESLGLNTMENCELGQKRIETQYSKVSLFLMIRMDLSISVCNVYSVSLHYGIVN